MGCFRRTSASIAVAVAGAWQEAIAATVFLICGVAWK
jgi:hypothetical protein